MPCKPDPLIRSSLVLRLSLWREIEEYRDCQRLVTTAEAVRQLLEKALLSAIKKREYEG